MFRLKLLGRKGFIVDGRRPKSNKDPPLPLMGRERWVVALREDFALVSEQLWEPRIILDFEKGKD
ncbi:UNVERIFIED_CONTAM: hypothetical protein Sindi_0978700 [Sesamum indicum]